MLIKKFLKNYNIPVKLLTFAAALSMLASPISALPVQAEQPAAVETTAATAEITAAIETTAASMGSMKGGAVLHAWCWSFETIKNNMALIADSGYTSIQTSPINACKEGDNGNQDKHISNWYFHYQPTDYTIGNYQLGLESQFKDMCDEAERYGIKVIVDVVANHTTDDYSVVSSNLKNIPYHYHDNFGEPISQNDYDTGNRRNITHKNIDTLADLNTHSTEYQNYVKSYVLRAVQLGADGFRYDAAKHIELPNETDSQGNFGSNFWPNILANGSEFQYGEILQGNGDNISGYGALMNVTSSAYGQKIRGAIAYNDVNAGTIMGYENSVSADKLVTWVESHDTYANSVTAYETSQWMNDEELKLGWGIVGAREAGTPLFFSRPVGGGGQDWDNRFPGNARIGDRGSNLFFDDEVVAVNKFRNAMVGQNEYLRNPNGNNQVLMIERGTKGVVIVNMTSSNYSLNSATNLANGSYTNQTDNNNTFTVSNGNISGTLPARSVVVLYEQSDGGSGDEITVYYYTGWVNPYIHYQVGNGAWTTAPGVAMSNSNISGYKVATVNLGASTTMKACFNNGSGSWDNNNGNDYYFSSPGTYTVKNGNISSGVPQS